MYDNRRAEGRLVYVEYTSLMDNVTTTRDRRGGSVVAKAQVANGKYVSLVLWLMQRL